jgi:hypothetical protein
LVRNVHDFEKFTIFSAFIIIIAGGCDSMKLGEKEIIAYHLPLAPSIQSNILCSVGSIGIARSTEKERGLRFIKAGERERFASPK